MEKLKERLDSCQRAVATLDEALAMPYSIIVRDGSIQRFEFSFEAVWKLLKAYLEQHEGIVCNSPKSCFREALRVGVLSAADTQSCLEMTDDRNLTAHTYIEAIAKRIYHRLPAYLGVMQSLATQVQTRI